MTPNDSNGFELTRRKVLGGLTTVGMASVGAGLGTTAYFSDREAFPNNSLTAGALDLKVDWEEHYSDRSDDEVTGLEYPVSTEAPENGDVPYVGLPDPQNPMLYVAEVDVEQFMHNTAVEAFPDPNNDGSQDVLIEGDDQFTYDACEMGADTPADLNPVDNLRTRNDDTYDREAEQYKPLVALDDVKPGDFGELTLSFHLCDNPGYVWLQGRLAEASENGLTEPEAKDPREEDGVVELLEKIQTVWWYDADGDNVIDEEASRTGGRNALR